MHRTEELMPLSAFCREARIPQSRAYELVTSGRLAAERGPNGRWRVSRAAADRFLAERAAQRDPVLPELAQSEPCASLEASIAAYGRALIQVEVIDRGMLADALEAANAGHGDLAAATREARERLRTSRIA